MWHWYGMGPLGWLIMLAFWVLVIVSIVWLIRATDKPKVTERDQPLHILDERLARGEIDPEDYERRRRVLETQV